MKTTSAGVLAAIAIAISLIAVWVSLGGRGTGPLPGTTANQTSTAGFYNAGQSGILGGYKVNGTTVIDFNRGAVFATTTTEALTEGGCTMATSTSAETNNLTFTATEMQSCRTWVITPGRIFQTLTFAASSSITTLVPNSGDIARIYVRNSTSTVGGEFRLASSTGFNFNPASTTPASVATTTPGDFAILTLIRRADTDIDVLVSPFK